MKRAKEATTEAIINQCRLLDSLVFKIIGIIFIIGLSWVFLFLLLHKELLPEGGLFRIAVLVLAAYAFGMLISLIRIPPLLGMLIVGICLRTIQFFYVEAIYREIISVMREIALAIILTLAGLGLDPAALKKNILNILKLSLIPCAAEACGAAVAGYFIAGLPWLWGFLLGFLLSSISPAVVVPVLLNLKNKGYGEDKGIATLVIAASSFDDIFSISVYGILGQIIFEEKKTSLVLKILQGPIELVIGFGVGISWGVICALIPHRKDECATLKKTILLALGGTIMVLGSEQLGYPGAGPLACVTSCVVANMCWKHQWAPGQPPPRQVASVYWVIWLIVQPMLFSMVGAEIDLTKLEIDLVTYSIIIIVIALGFRILTCVLVMIGSRLTWKEQIFVILSWIPKATVQAALGPHALEMVRKRQPNPEDEWRAKLLLTAAIISILLTAPIGSLGTTLSGEKLLKRVEPEAGRVETERPEDFRAH